MKSALITGSSHGIGRALAVFLARRGYRAICVARTEPELKETVDRIHSEGHAAEMLVADLQEQSGLASLVERVYDEFSDLSLLAHLATPRPDPEAEATLAGTSAEQIAGYLSTTIGATVVLTKELQPLLAQNAPSHLFFMSSDWALRGAHGPAVFAAAKAAVAHFGRSIRREMARSGIRTTILLPGDIASFDVNWEEPVWDLDDHPDQVIDALGKSRILLSDITTVIGAALDLRCGRLEEVVLAPDDAEYDY